MKKHVFSLLAICFLLIPALATHADVVVIPENDFFSRHSSDCVYLGRDFQTNGANGSVSVRNEPGSHAEIAVIENGEVVYVEYSCLYKGEFWGLASFYPNQSPEWQRLYGWIKIDGQLLSLYDYIAFNEAHSEHFYSYEGDYGEIKKAGAAVAWPWPGADSLLWTIEGLDTENFRVLHAYEDEQGREWGFVSRLYGSRNIWVCLTDPLNRDMPAFNPAPKPMIWESKITHNDIGEIWNPTLTLIVVLVAGLVIGTVILMKIFWKPNHEAGGNQNV